MSSHDEGESTANDSTASLSLKSLLSTPVTYKSQADLGMVRNWFYPQYVKDNTATYSFFDEAAAVAVSTSDGDAIDVTNEEIESAKQQRRNKLKAIRRVGIYKFRDKNVPHFITATAALVEAEIYYEDEMEKWLATRRKRKRGGAAAAVSRRRHVKQKRESTSRREGSSEEGHLDNYDDNESEEQNRDEDQIMDDDDDDDDEDTEEMSDIDIDLSSLPPPTTIMQSIFAMAFSRFVNGFVDKDRIQTYSKHKPSSTASATTKAATSETSSSSDEDEEITRAAKKAGAQSMYSHASKISMPSHFVDHRHRCHHGRELPSLEQLRKLNGEAIEWLWVRWWKVRVPHSHLQSQSSSSSLTKQSVQNAGLDVRLKVWETEEIERRLKGLRRKRKQMQREGGEITTKSKEGEGRQGHWETILDKEENTWNFVFVGHKS